MSLKRTKKTSGYTFNLPQSAAEHCVLHTLNILYVLYRIRLSVTAQQVLICTSLHASCRCYSRLSLSHFYQDKSTLTALLLQQNKLESLMSSSNNFWSCSTDNESQTDFMAAGQYPQIKFPGRGLHLWSHSS